MNAVQTPIDLEVRLTCPACGGIGATIIELGAELRIREDAEDGEIRELHPTVKKKAVRHHCGQETLDEAVDRFRQTVRDDITAGDVDQVTISHQGRTVDVATGEVLA